MYEQQWLLSVMFCWMFVGLGRIDIKEERESQTGSTRESLKKLLESGSEDAPGMNLPL